MIENLNRPWSEIGIDISDQKNVQEALISAGLDFTVKVMPAFYGPKRSAEPYNFIVRTDEPRVLGVCKGRYTPLQNSVMAEIVEPLTNVRLDTMGTFGNGEKVWILLKLADCTFEVRSGDYVDHYILLVNGHDGSTSIQIGIIPFRLWCANQFPMLGKHMDKFKHTENVEEMLQFFRQKLNEKIALIQGNVANYKKMAQVICKDPELYFRKVLKMPLTGSLTTRSQNILKSLSGNTYWEVFNSVNTYLNYQVGRKQETRLHSLWFGANNKTNERALQICLDALY
jgi:phage/plasmid-like protein (TIGR03299 family)